MLYKLKVNILTPQLRNNVYLNETIIIITAALGIETKNKICLKSCIPSFSIHDMRCNGGKYVHRFWLRYSTGMYEYSVSRVSMARCHEMSGFISYSGGCARLLLPLQKKPQNVFVWGKSLITVYGVRPTFA